MKISLFWRTFLLIALLIASSLGVGLTLVRQLDPTPPEQNLAWELHSVVNLTRNALITSQPSKRRELLADLEREEGVRIIPLEDNDRIQEGLPPDNRRKIEDAVQRLLGPDTVMAIRVNDLRGLWVSFKIEGDRYWLVLPEQRLERQQALPLIPVLVGLMLFALAGTYVMSRLVNKPLANLAQALSALGQGKTPAPLREDLASEIAAVNRRFNQMTRDLTQLEADRTLALAGISHDIRTPLTRLRMEVEMAKIPEDQREAMVGDLERINEIVAQFMDYARAGRGTEKEHVPVSDRLEALAQRFRQAAAAEGSANLSTDIAPALTWHGNGTDLERMVGNLMENARRYGKTPGTGLSEIRLEARLSPRASKSPALLRLIVSDKGPGVPPDKIESLKKPFMRLDEARGVHEGAGLGLAIVERIALRHGGSLHLGNRPETGGLQAEIVLPVDV